MGDSRGEIDIGALLRGVYPSRSQVLQKESRWLRGDRLRPFANWVEGKTSQKGRNSPRKKKLQFRDGIKGREGARGREKRTRSGRSEMESEKKAVCYGKAQAIKSNRGESRPHKGGQSPSS